VIQGSDSKQDILQGLSADDVRLRRQQGLVNAAPGKASKSDGQIIRENLFTMFNLYNFTIGAALFLVGAYANMLYLVIIIANILIGMIQEIRAKRLVEELSLIVAAKAAVVRDGERSEIPVEDLVLDDLTVLSAGSQICADSEIESGVIEVNESLLTGESDIITKARGDRLLSGSFVVSGRCFARVLSVGEENFAAKLAMEARIHKAAKSELLSSMRRITRLTGYFIIPIGIILFAEALFVRFAPLDQSVISTSAALLGMLPKGMVLLISTSLAVGIIKLSKQRVLVQDLYAIEALAHADVLCLDKTGTITEGKMKVTNIYETEIPSPLSITTEKALCCFTGASEDNNATFAALKERFPEDTGYDAAGKAPFSAERKWSAVCLKGLGTLVLGAPEVLTYHDGAVMPEAADAAIKSGKRILCFGHSDEILQGEAPPPVRLIAAIELSDPIRPNARETLDFFRDEGVGVKIISGDNPAAVSAIARQAGFEGFEDYIDASTLKSEDDIARAVEKYGIFGRVTPSQKSLIIKAIQKNGHKVAMAGDGVNDVLALKEADCGIAMASGSDATKQVAKLVLADSDFTALPDAVMEGRRVVNNVTRFGGVFLVKTIYSLLLSVFFIATLRSFPFTPLQIALCDLFIEALPAFTLAMLPNKSRITGKFMRTVISRAAPFSIAVLLAVAAVTFIAPVIGMPVRVSRLLMYGLVSFIGFAAAFMACRKFGRPGVAIWAFCFICFYSCAIVFAQWF